MLIKCPSGFGQFHPPRRAAKQLGLHCGFKHLKSMGDVRSSREGPLRGYAQIWGFDDCNEESEQIEIEFIVNHDSPIEVYADRLSRHQCFPSFLREVKTRVKSREVSH